MKKAPIIPQNLSVNAVIMGAFVQVDSSKAEGLLALQTPKRKVREYLDLIIGMMKFYKNGSFRSEF
ncbi:hypothetical protein GCM10011514_18710 [Emticicia aquatilis]|uniref:Uncharacterized protein n=1 Tax=Emticicia aquatilis TaxID=1537369 RepID=A0A916YP89_9BACT|nr:hypothetical protein GCM10011514_18710 [Emticicia aquatilis]